MKPYVIWGRRQLEIGVRIKAAPPRMWRFRFVRLEFQ